jgi:hypothetical protein
MAMGIAMALGGCAGRAPQPVAVVQAQDRNSDCTAITAEIEANNQKELASEQGLKVGQNVAAGVVGLVVWPLLFAMDSRIWPARKSLRSRAATNTSRPWRSRGACPRHRRKVHPIASIDLAPDQSARRV